MKTVRLVCYINMSKKSAITKIVPRKNMLKEMCKFIKENSRHNEMPSVTAFARNSRATLLAEANDYLIWRFHNGNYYFKDTYINEFR